jgi:hypothetical protein
MDPGGISKRLPTTLIRIVTIQLITLSVKPLIRETLAIMMETHGVPKMHLLQVAHGAELPVEEPFG